MVFSLGMAGLMGGSALLSANTARQAQERQRGEFRSMMKKRRTSPEGQALSEAVARLRGLSKDLPNQIRSGLRSQAISRSQANLGNLNRSLAQRGMTSGSDVYGRAQRGQISNTMSDLTNVETQAGQFESSLLGNLGRLSQSAGNYFNPMQMGPQEAYIDPMNIIGQGMMGGFLGGELFGGGGQDGTMSNNSSILGNYDNAMIPGGWDMASTGSARSARLPVLDIQRGDSW